MLSIKLKNPTPPIYVPYPEGFSGRRSGGTEDKSFSISTSPSKLTEAEVALAEKYVEKMKGSIEQSLIFTGAVFLDKDDPLKGSSHEALTEYEKANGLPLSETLPNGTTISDPYERLLRIREAEAKAKYAHLLR